MNLTVEEKLEQSVFERGAEKCTDQNTRITFCKEYLKKHGVDTKPTVPTYSLNELQNFGREETFTFRVKEAIDEYKLHSLNPGDVNIFKAGVIDTLIRKVSHDLYKNGFIRMDELKNYANRFTKCNI